MPYERPRIHWDTILYPYSKVMTNFSWMQSLRKKEDTILIYNGASYPVYTIGL